MIKLSNDNIKRYAAFNEIHDNINQAISEIMNHGSVSSKEFWIYKTIKDEKKAHIIWVEGSATRGTTLSLKLNKITPKIFLVIFL